MLALGFVVLFGLTMPPLLNLGTTNLLITSRAQTHRAQIYAADGATDAAIQYLRIWPGCGRPFQKSGSGPGQCPISSGPSTSSFQTTLNNKTATVAISASGAALTLDRTVTLTTTVAGASTSVSSTVVLHDPGTGDPAAAPVDVQSWVLKR